MPLGIDATIRYAAGQLGPAAARLQMQRDTPYNTRTRLGLPPTPIGNPGLASLKAAANPAERRVAVLRGQAVRRTARTRSPRRTRSSSAT